MMILPDIQETSPPGQYKRNSRKSVESKSEEKNKASCRNCNMLCDLANNSTSLPHNPTWYINKNPPCLVL